MPVRVKSSAALPFGLPAPPAGWPQKPPGISLCMIVRDEEQFLERCLNSVRGVVDEIVIVDTGSKDRTIEIARSFGATVIEREWRDDFAWARNEGLRHARYRWILQLDADEELLEDSKTALRQLKDAGAHFTGLWIRCFNRADQYLGDVGTLSHAVVRVFPNTERIRFCGAIHEFPSLDGATTTIKALGAPIGILHHGYTSDIVDARAKHERNLTIIEEATRQNPGDAYNWYNLGVTAHLGGNPERAAAALEQMWTLSKQYGYRQFVPNGLSLLSDILTDFIGKPNDALEFAREALKLAPRYGNAHFSAGRALEALQRYDEAREMFFAAIDDGAYLDRQFVADEDVPVWKAQNMIGGTYAAQGDDESALHWFEAGLKNRPKVQPLRINRANALERLRRVSEAEKALRELCEELGDEQSILQYVNFMLRHKPVEALSPIERYYSACAKPAAVALLLAAAAVVQRHGLGDGEQYLSAAQRIAPESAEVLGPLEAIYQARGDQAAIARLRSEEAQTQPETPLDFARRAQIAIAQGDFAAALFMAERGLEKAPADAMLRYSAASACSHLDRKADALAHLEAIEEASGELHHHIEYLRAILHRKLGRPQHALAVIENLLAVRGSQIDALLLRASLLESLGRHTEAEGVLQMALPLAKRRVAAELGGFYLRAGRFADAQRVAEEALA
jgi:tetratricopeptide (TPR) repeat protein